MRSASSTQWSGAQKVDSAPAAHDAYSHGLNKTCLNLCEPCWSHSASQPVRARSITNGWWEAGSKCARALRHKCSFCINHPWSMTPKSKWVMMGRWETRWSCSASQQVRARSITNGWWEAGSKRAALWGTNVVSASTTHEAWLLGPNEPCWGGGRWAGAAQTLSKSGQKSRSKCGVRFIPICFCDKSQSFVAMLSLLRPS